MAIQNMDNALGLLKLDSAKDSINISSVQTLLMRAS